MWSKAQSNSQTQSGVKVLHPQDGVRFHRLSFCVHELSGERTDCQTTVDGRGSQEQ